jgi:hypothetical protein
MNSMRHSFARMKSAEMPWPTSIFSEREARSCDDRVD